MFVANDLEEYSNVSLQDKEQAYFLLTIKQWVPQAQLKLLSCDTNPLHLPMEVLGAKRSNTDTDVLLAAPLVIKLFFSDPGVSCLQPASIKQYQANILACKKVK